MGIILMGKLIVVVGDRGSHFLACLVQHEEKGALILQIGRRPTTAAIKGLVRSLGGWVWRWRGLHVDA